MGKIVEIELLEVLKSYIKKRESEFRKGNERILTYKFIK